MLKFYDDIVAGVNNAVIFQSTALLFFVIFFVGIIFMVMRRPKDYYNEISNSPLDEDEININNSKNTNQ